MATIVDIADAIVDELNGGTFSQAFTAERSYLPRFELPDMATLHVTVIPKSMEISQAGGTRAKEQYDYRVDVAVQKREAELDELDALMSLVEEIADYLTGRALDTSPVANWIGTENSPIYAPEHMGEFRQFTSIITVTYRCWR